MMFGIVLMKFLMNHLLDLHPKTQNSFKIIVQFNKLILILCTMIIFKKFNRLEDAFKKKITNRSFAQILTIKMPIIHLIIKHKNSILFDEGTSIDEHVIIEDFLRH